MDARGATGFDDRATRERARAARRLRDAERREASDRKVFAVRASPPDHGFRWEIRRFGSFALHVSDETYGTADSAQVAGEAALARRSDCRNGTTSSKSASEPATSVGTSEDMAPGPFDLETAGLQ